MIGAILTVSLLLLNMLESEKNCDFENDLEFENSFVCWYIFDFVNMNEIEKSKLCENISLFENINELGIIFELENGWVQEKSPVSEKTEEKVK